MDWVTKLGRNFNLLSDQGWSHLRSNFDVDCEGESSLGLSMNTSGGGVYGPTVRVYI